MTETRFPIRLCPACWRAYFDAWDSARAAFLYIHHVVRSASRPQWIVQGCQLFDMEPAGQKRCPVCRRPSLYRWEMTPTRPFYVHRFGRGPHALFVAEGCVERVWHMVHVVKRRQRLREVQAARRASPPGP